LICSISAFCFLLSAFLKARFGEIPYELREELQALGNETVLKRLPRLAAVVTGLDDFRRQLRKP